MGSIEIEHGYLTLLRGTSILHSIGPIGELPARQWGQRIGVSVDTTLPRMSPRSAPPCWCGSSAYQVGPPSTRIGSFSALLTLWLSMMAAVGLASREAAWRQRT